jgi:hypothetical protein
MLQASAFLFVQILCLVVWVLYAALAVLYSSAWVIERALTAWSNTSSHIYKAHIKDKSTPTS